ncbi:MAG: geranylgeranyl reductase family protein [Acidobacteriota bacterium]
MQCDVLVIGSGPAGAAAARRAALHGYSVVLVDAATFPRDKVCGDALIPDALRALHELAVTSRIAPLVHEVAGLRVHAPNGRRVNVPGASWVVPRALLDEALREAAVEAGAVFHAPWKAVAPILAGTTVAGARLRRTSGDAELSVHARVTILATGASSEALRSFGVCRRMTPSAMAARLYIDVDPAATACPSHLDIVYDAPTCPGYGWVFPAPGGRFNVGVACFYDARRRPVPRNLRILLQRFLERYPPAVDLVRRARSISPLRGAPLRTAMCGADFARPGLLVVGDAAGLTYSCTGEGIGKALESGMLAADVIAAASSRSAAAADAIAQTFARELAASYARTYESYRRAQRWLSSPLRANLLAWRANSSSFVRHELEAMFAGRGGQHRLFSPLGLVRGLVA